MKHGLSCAEDEPVDGPTKKKLSLFCQAKRISKAVALLFPAQRWGIIVPSGFRRPGAVPGGDLSDTRERMKSL